MYLPQTCATPLPNKARHKRWQKRCQPFSLKSASPYSRPTAELFDEREAAKAFLEYQQQMKMQMEISNM